MASSDNDDVARLRAENAHLAQRVHALEKVAREMTVSLARTQGWLGMLADGHTLPWQKHKQKTPNAPQDAPQDAAPQAMAT